MLSRVISQDIFTIFYIDVATQSTSPGWTLQKWAEYMELEPGKRDKILNVISLEISSTKLSDMVSPPRLVQDLDWVENYWPTSRKGRGYSYPKVQLYCLMGVANAWTVRSLCFSMLSGLLTFGKRRIGILTLLVLRFIITSCTAPRSKKCSCSLHKRLILILRSFTLFGQLLLI